MKSATSAREIVALIVLSGNREAVPVFTCALTVYVCARTDDSPVQLTLFDEVFLSHVICESFS